MDNKAEISNGRTLVDRIASSELTSAVEKWAKSITELTASILFRQGDEPEAVYYLKAGEVTLTMRSGERIIMSARVPAGSLLGLPAIMGNKPYSLTATAVGQVEAYRISHDDFKQMIVQERLCFDVVRILAGEVHSARIALAECLDQHG
jgi:CRP-like cAMP-binding protein